jgi:hypothetical protein
LHVQFHLGPVEEKRLSRRSRTAVACIVIASLPGVLHSRGVIRTNSGRLHQPLCVSLPLNMVQIILIPTYQWLITQYSLFNFIYEAIFVPTHIFHLGHFFSFHFRLLSIGLEMSSVASCSLLQQNRTVTWNTFPLFRNFQAPFGGNRVLDPGSWNHTGRSGG